MEFVAFMWYLLGNSFYEAQLYNALQRNYSYAGEMLLMLMLL